MRHGSPILNFLALLAVALACLGAVGYFYASTEIRHDRNILGSDEREALALSSNTLRLKLNGLVSDAIYLVNLPALQRAIRTPTEGMLARVASNFSTFMDTQRTYDQLRWIDETGMERLRLNFIDGRARRVPDEALQQKVQRPSLLSHKLS